MKVLGSQLIGPNGQPLPLSSAIELDGLVYLSGQIALKDGKVTGDVAAQTDQIFDAIEAVLSNTRLSLDHIFKATVWLTEISHFSAFNAVYEKRLKAPFPVRSCVISQLVLPNACVEIEVAASRGQSRV
jgi:reactive intermediate/imine deaminase